MTNDELFHFYMRSGANESQSLISRCKPDEMTRDDLLHFIFCNSAAHNMVVYSAKRIQKDGTTAEKILAGFKIYEEFVLKHKYRVWN